MIELPADAGAGHGLFQNLHGGPDGDAFSKRLRHACEQHHGHAAPLFLEDLVANRGAAVAAVREQMGRWLGQHLGRDAAGQVSRVAHRFALIAAAGELATTWGIVPWAAGTAVRYAAWPSVVSWTRLARRVMSGASVIALANSASKNPSATHQKVRLAGFVCAASTAATAARMSSTPLASFLISFRSPRW